MQKISQPSEKTGSNNLDIPEYKVILIGDGGVGKSTFLRRHVTGEFERYPETTLGVEVISTVFYTNLGPIRLNIWDTAGQEKLCPLREGYYLGADAAIMMFDLQSRITFKNIPRWYKDLKNIIKNDIPVVLLGNKVDLPDRKIKFDQITWHKQYGIQYYDVSAYSMYQYDLPFLYILQRLRGDELFLVNSYSKKPEQDNLDLQHLKGIEQDIKKIQDQDLPNDDEEFV